MSKSVYSGLFCSALILSATGAISQEFSWESEIEIGVESVLDSNVPSNEVDDPFIEALTGFEFTYGNVGAFAAIKLEQLTRPSAGLQDLALYFEELGVLYGNDRFNVRLGKSAPVFGSSWDDADGYFTSAIPEDFELLEQIGIFGEYEVIDGGTLSASVFYADNTELSRSVGADRLQNRTSAGGVGNTGELDNFAIGWRHELEKTYYYVGARQLSRGIGDAKDELGFVGGIGHSFDTGSYPIDLYGEVASFDGHQGTVNDAVYATLSVAVGIGSNSFSFGFSHRDIDNTGETNMYSVGLDHEFDNGMSLGGAIGFIDDAGGVEETVFGASLIIPLGG